jgi:hypothetical protein
MHMLILTISLVLALIHIKSGLALASALGALHRDLIRIE